MITKEKLESYISEIRNCKTDKRRDERN